MLRVLSLAVLGLLLQTSALAGTRAKYCASFTHATTAKPCPRALVVSMHVGHSHPQYRADLVYRLETAAEVLEIEGDDTLSTGDTVEFQITDDKKILLEVVAHADPDRQVDGNQTTWAFIISEERKPSPQGKR